MKCIIINRMHRVTNKNFSRNRFFYQSQKMKFLSEFAGFRYSAAVLNESEQYQSYDFPQIAPYLVYCLASEINVIAEHAPGPDQTLSPLHIQNRIYFFKRVINFRVSVMITPAGIHSYVRLNLLCDRDGVKVSINYLG